MHSFKTKKTYEAFSDHQISNVWTVGKKFNNYSDFKNINSTFSVKESFLISENYKAVKIIVPSSVTIK